MELQVTRFLLLLLFYKFTYVPSTNEHAFLFDLANNYSRCACDKLSTVSSIEQSERIKGSEHPLMGLTVESEIQGSGCKCILGKKVQTRMGWAVERLCCSSVCVWGGLPAPQLSPPTPLDSYGFFFFLKSELMAMEGLEGLERLKKQGVIT